VFVETVLRHIFTDRLLIGAQSELKEAHVTGGDVDFDRDESALCVVLCHYATAIKASFIVGSGTRSGPDVTALAATALIHRIVLYLYTIMNV